MTYTGGNMYLAVILLSLLSCLCGADICVFDNRVEICDYGCCDDECCDFSTLAIVGIVIGGIFLLAALISCGFCIYFMCKKRSGRNNTAVQPYSNTNTVYVHNNPYGTAPPRVNPPPYGQSSAYPAYSSQFDPAYPPGAVDHPPPAYTYSNPSAK